MFIESTKKSLSRRIKQCSLTSSNGVRSKLKLVSFRSAQHCPKKTQKVMCVGSAKSCALEARNVEQVCRKRFDPIDSPGNAQVFSSFKAKSFVQQQLRSHYLEELEDKQQICSNFRLTGFLLHPNCRDFCLFPAKNPFFLFSPNYPSFETDRC